MDDDARQFLLGEQVLVVEDDAMVGMVLVNCLEDLGADVSWSSTVEDALDNISKIHHIAIAIVDFNLNGSTSALIIDALISRKIPTVLCTGYDESFLEQRFHVLPCVAKPFTRSKMMAVLHKMVLK